MKIMISMNVKELEKVYNFYGDAFGKERLDVKTVYKLLMEATNCSTEFINTMKRVLLSTEEAEKFADKFVKETWHKIAIEEATKIIIL